MTIGEEVKPDDGIRPAIVEPQETWPDEEELNRLCRDRDMRAFCPNAPTLQRW